jgi:hypothetical protein
MRQSGTPDRSAGVLSATRIKTACRSSGGRWYCWQFNSNHRPGWRGRLADFLGGIGSAFCLDGSDSTRGSWFPAIDPVLRGCEAGFYRFTIRRPCMIKHEGYESTLNALLVVDIYVSHTTGGVFPNCDLNMMLLVEMLHSPAPPEPQF